MPLSNTPGTHSLGRSCSCDYTAVTGWMSGVEDFIDIYSRRRVFNTSDTTRPRSSAEKLCTSSRARDISVLASL